MPPDSGEQTKQKGESFFPVSPLLLFPKTHGKFSVFLRQDKDFVLYADQGERFTEENRQRLYDLGVKEVYVLGKQRERFERYVEDNLGNILANEEVPVAERAGIFYDASISIVKNVFSTRLPSSLSRRQFQSIADFVRQSAKFLSAKDVLKSLGSLISHDYKVYRHSVNVFVFTMSILQTYKPSERVLLDTGLGAILHDIGKLHIPKEILDSPIKLSEGNEEIFRTHPVKGVAMCASLPLSVDVINAILFHHERMDGSGYPSGISGEAIPLPVQVLAVANAYETLIAGRPHTKGLTPYQALRVLSEDQKGAFDPEAVKRLVLVLSGADMME